jgi:hypothetical protein
VNWLAIKGAALCRRVQTISAVTSSRNRRVDLPVPRRRHPSAIQRSPTSDPTSAPISDPAITHQRSDISPSSGPTSGPTSGPSSSPTSPPTSNHSSYTGVHTCVKRGESRRAYTTRIRLQITNITKFGDFDAPVFNSSHTGSHHKRARPR